MEQQAKIEQYKQEMLAQARRSGTPAAAAAEVKVIAPAPTPPAREKVAPAEHVERVLEKAESIVEAAEPIAEIALRSGLVSAGAAVAAKGIELGVEALEAHIEKKKAEHATPPAPEPPAPPAPPPPAPVVDINFTQQIEQTATAVVAPVVTAPAVAAPAAAPVVTVQPAPAPVVPTPPPAPIAPPVVAVPLPVPAPPVQMPVPVPLPPVFPPAQARPPIAPPPAPSMLIPPVSTPVAVPVRPAECKTVTCTVQAAPCRRPQKPCCPIHNPRPKPCAPCKPAPRPCSCKSPRVSPQAESASWFMQPAVEAAYAAYTADLPPVQYDDTVAYRAPQAVPVATMPEVAYASAPQQYETGYYELPVQDYASLDDYLARNTARGILELQVRVASDDAAPVQGANVDVLRTINGVTYLFYHGVTDANGSAGRISLPAPDRSLSFAPPQGFVPYAVYTVSVSHGNYAPQVLENVTVFPDTESVQVVRLGQAPVPFVMDEGRYVM